MKVSEYVKNKTARQNTPFVIINGAGFYRVNGCLVVQAEFEKKFPISLILGLCNENPDKTKLWMQ
jgi:hypothetical protein